MPSFRNGVSVNKCGNNGKYERLRIKAGPQRDRYVDELILEAKLGRPLGPGMTVDHQDGNSLNVHPSNLIEVTHVENIKLMNARVARRKRKVKAAAAAGDDGVPF